MSSDFTTEGQAAATRIATPVSQASGGSDPAPATNEAGGTVQGSSNQEAKEGGLPSETPDGSRGTIADLLRSTQEQLQSLRETFDEKIRYDASREAIIDRLHTELQEYKADLLLKTLKPLVLDLIDMHDKLGKRTDSGRDKAADSFADKSPLLQACSEIQSDLEMILVRNGFEPFITTEETFDPKRQRVVRPITTKDASLDRKIAERVRKGVSYEGRVIRPEMVNVYVYNSQS